MLVFNYVRMVTCLLMHFFGGCWGARTIRNKYSASLVTMDAMGRVLCRLSSRAEMQWFRVGSLVVAPSCMSSMGYRRAFSVLLHDDFVLHILWID
jgi:hypothetical protein